MTKLKTTLLSAMLLSGTALFAQTKVASVEGITEYDFPNGLKVLLFPDPSKATATVNMTYLVGSRMEGYGETGMAHLLEHMVFKGSPKHTNIPNELTSHGARPNGSTNFDRTNYFETFSATDENLKWALDLESDRMVNSFIAKKDLETEFSVVRNEFESGENNPSSILYERVMSTAYLWHNSGKSTIGSREDIEKVPIENLQAFYHKFYQPDNVVLTVAGKIDVEKTLKLINEYFGKIPKPTRVLGEPYTVEPTQDGERSVTLRRIGDLQVVSAGYHISNGVHPDYAPVEILTEVLSNQPSGRLYKALVETKKATSVSASTDQLRDPGYLYMDANVLKEKSVEDARSTMLNFLDDLKNNPVKDDEVERAKNSIMKNIDLLMNNSDRVGLVLSEFIAKGDWRLLFLYRDAIKKVSAADVNRVVASYLKPSNRTTGLFIPDAAPDRAAIPSNPDVAALVKDYKGNAAMATVATFEPSPQNVEANTKRGTLKGGAKYALLKKANRGNAISAAITLHIGNAQSLSEKATAADLTADMLDKGTANHTRQQLKDELDKLKTQLSVNCNGQTVNITVRTVKENLIPALKLVGEMLRHPVFPESEFEKLKEENVAGIDEQKSEPAAVANNLMAQLMKKYDKKDFRFTKSFDDLSADYKAAKLEDVKNFYTQYSGADATISVVGEYDEAATIAELNNIMEGFTSSTKFVRVPDVAFNPAARNEKVNTPDKANANFVCSQELALNGDDPDFGALTIANYMLGGGFLNSRLSSRIRQKEGISYGVGSFLQPGEFEKVGSFGAFAIYNPANSDKLMAAFKEEIQKVITTGFTDQELKDAKSGFLQGQNVSRSDDNYLRSKLNSNLYLNRTMQWNIYFENKIKNTTVADVNSIIKKWINPDKMSFVQAGDFDKKK